MSSCDDEEIGVDDGGGGISDDRDVDGDDSDGIDDGDDWDC